MTVASPLSRIDCPGNGSATVFSFSPVVVTQAADLTVYYRTAAGVETLLTQGNGTTNYKLNFTTFPNTGSITYPSTLGTVMPTGDKLVIKRIVPETQATALVNQGPYFANVQEARFDYQTFIDQQLQEQLNRTLTTANTDPASPLTLPTSTLRANQLLGFDASGNPIAAQPGSALISSAMQPVANAATLAIARGLLSVLGGYDVKAFGAVGNGVADDTAAFTAAIAAAGGASSISAYVDVPPGNYKITSTLNIGNGTSSSASTVSGIILRGSGTPIMPAFWPGYAAFGPTTLTWAGGGAPMIQVNGPVQGWGVENLLLNGATGTATIGLNVISGQFGHCKNLTVRQCQNGIFSTTVAPFGAVTNTDSIHNVYDGTMIQMPQLAGAKGIVLTGITPTFSSNTDYNEFRNTFIAMAGALQAFGVLLANCDSNKFFNLHLAGGSAASSAVVVDYTAVTGAVMPIANSFFGVDVAGNPGSVQWAQVGSPAANAIPNYIKGLDEANGSIQPAVTGILQDLPKLVSTAGVSARTTAVGSGPLYVPLIAGIYRINLYYAVTTVGNAVNLSVTFTWNDGYNNQTFTSGTISCAGITYSSATLIVLSSATSMSWSTTLSGGIGAGQYAVSIAVEKIG